MWLLWSLPGPRPTIVPPIDSGKMSCKPWAPVSLFPLTLDTQPVSSSCQDLFLHPLLSLSPKESQEAGMRVKVEVTVSHL